jgi:aldehyde dehydrogenase (NAD+)
LAALAKAVWVLNHGKAGFDAFSHTKSIVDKKNWIDLPMRYQPYKVFLP